MSQTNNLEFEVWGENALFSTPVSRGSEKSTETIPPYQALIGIIESVYWKPTFRYIIDRVRVMNQIRVESKGIRPIKLNGSPDLAYYSYLVHPRYQVQAHIEWNLQRPDLEADRNMKKHVAIFNRALSKGGRRDVFLGTRECQAYVRPVKFGEGVGFYDNQSEHERFFSSMVHGFNYPDETGKSEFSVRFWNPVMRDGVIDFPRPEDVKNVQLIREVTPPDPSALTQSVDTLYDELLGGDHA